MCKSISQINTPISTCKGKINLHSPTAYGNRYNQEKKKQNFFHFVEKY